MIFVRRNFYSLFVLVCLSTVSVANVSAKTDLIIKGSVVAGIIQKEPFPFGIGLILPINRLIVKVKSVKKGSLRSDFISVIYPSDNRFDESRFGFVQTLEFKLKREKVCDDSLENFMFFRERNENGQVLYKVPAFGFKFYAVIESLSLKRIMPCYWIEN